MIDLCTCNVCNRIVRSFLQVEGQLTDKVYRQKLRCIIEVFSVKNDVNILTRFVIDGLEL